MKAIDIKEFFLTPNAPEAIQTMYGLSSRNLALTLLKDLRYSFEEAEHTLGIQELEEILWTISPGTLFLSGLEGDPGFPGAFAQSIDRYATAFVRQRNDGQVVIYVGGYEGPIHINADETLANKEEWGTPKGIVRGIVKLVQDLGFPLLGFDGYLDIPFQPGRGYSSSSVFSALIVQSLLGQKTVRWDQMDFLTNLVQKYQAIMQEFFGSPLHPLPLATGLAGGSLCYDTLSIKVSSPWNEGFWILGDLPTGLNLPRKISSGEQATIVFPDMNQWLQEITNRRTEWEIGTENKEYLQSLKEKSQEIFGTIPVVFPYGTNLGEIRSFLAYLEQEGPDPWSWAQEMFIPRSMILRNEYNGTRTLHF